MFSLDNVVLPIFLESKLAMLSSYGVMFGGFVEHLNNDTNIIIWISVIFIPIIFFKNSTEKLYNFHFSKIELFIGIVTFVGGFLSLSQLSEFLYFNF
jgi:hypothetical protein